MIKYTLTIFLLTACTLTAADAPIPVAGAHGEAGHQDGTGANARFSDPSGLARDAQGNIYICDSRNHVIRKVAPGGIVTTLAGNPGESGAVNGIGAAARFHFPADIAVAPNGTLYVADTGNHCIRMISTARVVTTLAGDLGSSDDIDKSYGTSSRSVSMKKDGMGKAARFNSPSGITYAPAGFLYVSDTGNHIIRKVTLKGAVTTIAGKAGEWGALDGSGTKARFNSPMGLCISTDGNLFITDSMNHTIRSITPKGLVTTYAGNPLVSAYKSGPRLEARFSEPTDITPHPKGGFIICESLGNTIYRLDAEGNVSLFYGQAVAEPGDSPNALANPNSAICDPNGNVYVADTFHHELRLIFENQ